MASTVIPALSSLTFTVPAGNQLAIYSAAPYIQIQRLNFTNEPSRPQITNQPSGLRLVTAQTMDSTYRVETGLAPAYFNIGVNPVVTEAPNFQPTPAALNATGALTLALIASGLVTTTTAAAVTATLDTGAVLDGNGVYAVGDSFDWSAVNTGPNTFTVTAATGHTLVGSGAVATGTSGRFRTTKTASATFVTYRLS